MDAFFLYYFIYALTYFELSFGLLPDLFEINARNKKRYNFVHFHIFFFNHLFQLIPVNCDKCHQNFCLKHRHELDHQCKGFEDTGRGVSRAA